MQGVLLKKMQGVNHIFSKITEVHLFNKKK